MAKRLIKYTKDEEEFLGNEKKMVEEIYKIIKAHPEGISMQQISKIMKISRIIVKGYVLLLLGKGLIKTRRVGVTKLLKP